MEGKEILEDSCFTLHIYFYTCKKKICIIIIILDIKKN